MGNTISHNIIKNVNYNCPICMEEGNLPNLAGRFYIINNNMCQCNGCNIVYPKNWFFKDCSHII